MRPFESNYHAVNAVVSVVSRAKSDYVHVYLYRCVSVSVVGTLNGKRTGWFQVGQVT